VVGSPADSGSASNIGGWEVFLLISRAVLPVMAHTLAFLSRFGSDCCEGPPRFHSGFFEELAHSCGRLYGESLVLIPEALTLYRCIPLQASPYFPGRLRSQNHLCQPALATGPIPKSRLQKLHYCRSLLTSPDGFRPTGALPMSLVKLDQPR